MECDRRRGVTGGGTWPEVNLEGLVMRYTGKPFLTQRV